MRFTRKQTAVINLVRDGATMVGLTIQAVLTPIESVWLAAACALLFVAFTARLVCLVDLLSRKTNPFPYSTPLYPNKAARIRVYSSHPIPPYKPDPSSIFQDVY